MKATIENEFVSLNCSVVLIEGLKYAYFIHFTFAVIQKRVPVVIQYFVIKYIFNFFNTLR